MIQPHCGSYQYKDNFYSDRESLFEAMILNNDFNFYPKFYFNDDIFSKIDWTREPNFSLEDLYKFRAKQIRDEYEYVVLSYSGGSDSTEILETFLNNNIFIDEIQTVHYSGLIKKTEESIIMNNDSLAVMLEYQKAVLPKLKRVRELSPNTKITEIDVSEYTHNQITNNKLDYMGLSGQTTNGTGLIKPLRTNTFYMHNYNQQNFKISKKTAFVRGYDKPILNIENGRLMFRFSDITLHGVKMIRSGQIDDLYTFEDFFWSRKFPLIPVKQSHVIKKRIQKDKVLRESIVNFNEKMIKFNETNDSRTSFTTEVLERVYSKLIYKYENTIDFIAPKPVKNPESTFVNMTNKTHFEEIMCERAKFYLSKYDKIYHKRLLRRTILSKPYNLGSVEE